MNHCPRLVGLGRDFTLLCAGQAVSQLGSRGYGVAIALWILDATGSAATVGLVSSVTLAVFAGAQPLAGWIVDRFDRRRVMTLCDAASALAVCSLALAPFALPHVLASASVLASGWAVRGTAESAALPNVVNNDQLEKALTLMVGRGHATGIAGPLLAGTLFVVSPVLFFLVDACSYLVAGACAMAVRRPMRSAAPPTVAGAGAIEGMRIIWRHPFLRFSTLAAAATGFAISSSALVMLVVFERNGVMSTTIGLAITATYVGGLVGTVASRVASQRFSAPHLFVTGLGTAVITTSPMIIGTPPAVFITCVLLLLAQPLWWIPMAANWNRMVSDEVRGRADAAMGLAVASTTAVAPSITGMLVDLATPREIGLLLTVLMGVTALAIAANRKKLTWGQLLQSQ